MLLLELGVGLLELGDLELGVGQLQLGELLLEPLLLLVLGLLLDPTILSAQLFFTAKGERLLTTAGRVVVEATTGVLAAAAVFAPIEDFWIHKTKHRKQVCSRASIDEEGCKEEVS